MFIYECVATWSCFYMWLKDVLRKRLMPTLLHPLSILSTWVIHEAALLMPLPENLGNAAWLLHPAHVTGHVTFPYAAVYSARGSVPAFLCSRREALLDYGAGVSSYRIIPQATRRHRHMRHSPRGFSIYDIRGKFTCYFGGALAM